MGVVLSAFPATWVGMELGDGYGYGEWAFWAGARAGDSLAFSQTFRRLHGRVAQGSSRKKLTQIIITYFVITLTTRESGRPFVRIGRDIHSEATGVNLINGTRGYKSFLTAAKSRRLVRTLAKSVGT